MLGAVIVAIVIVLLIPIGIMMFGAVMSAGFSWLLLSKAETDHPEHLSLDA